MSDAAVPRAPLHATTLVVFGGDDGSVYALDAKSGALRRRFKTGGCVDPATLTNQDLADAASRDERQGDLDHRR